MKKLLNAVLFGSMFFVALSDASERGVLRTGRDVSTKMFSEHPYLTTIGSSFIGADMLASLKGIRLNAFGGATFNYFRNNALVLSRQILPAIRGRNFGAMLLGYSFYKTYKNKL